MKKPDSSSFEFIRVTDNIVETDDGYYFQIECIKTHKDKHYQRVINKGELGGYVHVESIQYLQDKWIEKDQAVGKLTLSEGKLTKVEKKRYNSSMYKEFYFEIEKYYKWIRIKAQTNKPSKRNAVLTHGKRILEMIIEVVNYEIKLDNLGFNKETHMIVLWTMIGSIQEAILKLHTLAFEDKYRELQPKAKEPIWDEKVDTIIRTLLKLEHINHNELITLEKINSNRSMIHLLNFGSVFNYQEYLRHVKESCDIYKRLFVIQEDKYEV